MRRVAVVALLAGLLLGVTVQSGSASNTVTPCSSGGHALLMDLYQPEPRPAGALPVVVYVHGGAWVSGSRQDKGDLFPELLPRLRSGGVVTAAVDYRLASEARWPAPERDVECAVSYLRVHSTALGIDPHRIRLYGTSAGGQIVSMLGLERTPGVDRVVDMYGPADLAAPGWSAWLRSDIEREFGAVDGSPVNHVKPGAPPFLLVQGACDTVVAAAQSRALAARLRGAGDRVTYVEVPGAGHGLWRCHGGGRPPAVDPVLDRIASFLAR